MRIRGACGRLNQQCGSSRRARGFLSRAARPAASTDFFLGRQQTCLNNNHSFQTKATGLEELTIDKPPVALLQYPNAMSSRVSACKKLGLLAWVGLLPFVAVGQARFDLQGEEYRILGGLQGDQMFPQLALNPFGGYLVWQDNATDGDGTGISARRINRSLSGSLGNFRVNEGGVGDQAQPAGDSFE